jgi:hypothetical protein
MGLMRTDVGPALERGNIRLARLARRTSGVA